MKLFGFDITRERKAITREDILSELANGGSAAKSGARINWKTALEVTTALACARVIAEGLAQVPFKLFREQDGNKIAAADHPLYALLAEKPNDWQTSFELREQIALHLVFCGDAFLWKNRVGNRIVELLPYEPNCVTVKRSGWELTYQVTTDEGRQITIPASEMWHLRGPSWSGWKGLESVKLAREALGLALATEEHGARLFSNGAAVGGTLSTEKDLKKDQVELLRESWERSQGGNRNAFKTAILWGGLKWEPRGMQSDQAQLLEQRRFQVEEICRAFRVMPIMVGYSDKAATYASAEQMFLAHVVHTMGPWYGRIEQSANANLLTEKERAAGLYFKFMPQGLMRGAHKDRAEFYAKLYSIGAINPNEIRALEDMNPYEGGEEYRVPLNMVEPGAEPAPELPAEDPALKSLLAEVKSLRDAMSRQPDTPQTINVTSPAITINQAETRVENNLPAPVTHVAAPNVDVNVAAPNVEVAAPVVEVSAPVVNLEATLAQPTEMTVHIVSMPTRETESEVERDSAGNIVSSTQVERDV